MQIIRGYHFSIHRNYERERRREREGKRNGMKLTIWGEEQISKISRKINMRKDKANYKVDACSSKYTSQKNWQSIS